MSSRPWDVRLRRVTWQPVPTRFSVRRRVRLLSLLALPFAVWYFGWLLNPDRVGTPYLYGVLIAAELFNLTQALGFWWTCANERVRERRAPTRRVAVDVFIPVYKEPPEIVDLTVAAAVGLRSAEVRVWVLDDGNDDEMRELALRHGVGYIRRAEHTGAKAGNINHALTKTDAPFIAVFDSDHVADPEFLEATLGHMDNEQVAFVQTPQYYANAETNRIAAASWAQQALFFGAIARGKDGLDAVFCCGTNVLFRRTAFESVGGFPTNSLTEDFELSIHLHERGWKSIYVPDVLARGLGPEDTAAYVSQQQRWARGCLSGIPRALRAKLPLKLKAQYLLSGMYFLSGWTVLIYMSFPVIRLLGGGQPIGGIDAPEFLLHFAPYYIVALSMAALAGAGSYTFGAFALSAANFWIHVLSTIYTVLRRSGSFVVTPKTGAGARQPGAVMPALVAVAVLVSVSIYGLVRHPNASTINNVSFAFLHVSILMAGCWAALEKPRAPTAEPLEAAEVAA
ncbi:MAG TPA: glycosyltransferase [Thermoleophilaceae bacterium]|jgi:cellulose synthase (UDP-forming)